jgi:hypothetical protein
LEYKNAPRYLITQLSIHSGHKLAIKTTEIASNYAETFFCNGDKKGYEEIKSFEAYYDEGAKGWPKIFEYLR